MPKRKKATDLQAIYGTDETTIRGFVQLIMQQYSNSSIVKYGACPCLSVQQISDLFYRRGRIQSFTGEEWSNVIDRLYLFANEGCSDTLPKSYFESGELQKDLKIALEVLHLARFQDAFGREHVQQSWDRLSRKMLHFLPFDFLREVKADIEILEKYFERRH